ncbi:PREDICTED: uncharacterized protein LOC108372637 [Rhagoletis zephyria]|uniref:uncharacterized protein LOC108372637 n=1 Tax=Rhagoletis zephyria TaxID=28612 RepID=UPI000811A313|nr:PREDICTED: uncharacterized protein LOC108372637 [Rhagoletis zephyria]XP_036319725.1 uncharacterized protein LOC118734120 [Rhagoletis pomonella]
MVLLNNSRNFMINNEESQNVEELVQVQEQTNREDLSNTSFSSISELAPPRKNKKKSAVGKQNELIEKACSLLSAPQSSTNINATALYWSEKLEHLNRTQRMLAEKGINDILFEAELGNLRRDSVNIIVYPDASNTDVSSAPTQEPTMYNQLPALPRFSESSPQPDIKAIRVRRPAPIYVPPPTPSPDSNFGMSLQSEYITPNYPHTPSPILSSQLPPSGQAMLIYNTEVGATEEIQSTEEYSLRSFFSSFPGN